MPELSQIVRQRLASRGVAGDHPDADTLTAYAEQLLPSAERSRVLEHIAACGHCREVVALSLPEPVESAVATLAAPRRRTWRWPALGLAGSLAMLAVVAGVIIELPRKPATFQYAKQSPAPVNPSQEDSLKAAAKSEAAPGAGTSAADRTSGPGVSSIVSGNVTSARGQAMAPAPPPPLPTPVRSDSVSSASSSPAGAEARLHERDYVNKQMFVAEQANEVRANPADVPAAPMPRLAQNQFPPPLSTNTPLAFAGIPPQIEAGKVTRSRQLSNPANHPFGIGLFPNLPALGRKAEAKVEAMAKRTVAIPPGALSFSAMESKAPNPAQEEQVQAANAEVTEKPKADLDQSSVFTQRALVAGNAAEYRYETGAPAWRVNSGKLLKSGGAGLWTEGYSGESIEFTAVAAHGPNVWAGGANAALIHSANGGATWERITLGTSATGSITAIEAAGANVQVKSSSGQEWSSQDGGKTWLMDK